VSSAALTALSRLLPTLHLADWTNKEAIVNTLLNTLMDTSSSSSSSMLAVAAVEAAGFVGVTLLQQHADAGGLVGFKEAGDRGLALGCSCLGLLLSCFTATFSSSSSSAAAAVVAKLPSSCRDLVMLQELRFTDEVLQNPEMAAAAALKGCFAVLAALQKRLQPAAAAAAAAAGVLADFVLKQVSAAPASSHSSRRSATAVAVAAATPAAAAASAAAAGVSSPQHLAAVSAQLQRLVTGSSGDSSDTRVCAAAAVSWTQLVVLQLAAATGAAESAQVGPLSRVQYSTGCTETLRTQDVLQCAACCL
jgi:hypothetical protein